MMEALDISEYDAKDKAGLDELVATQKPFVVRGLINHWPLKKMGEALLSACRNTFCLTLRLGRW